MSKVKRKELVEKANDHELRLFQIEKALEQHGINWFVEEPKLKVLDQSVFSHPYVDDRFNYVALNADGQSIFFEQKPSVSVNLDIWVATGGSIMPMLKGYDASNWQNSLIERDKVELTGNALCLKLLNLDLDVMCDVKDGDYRLIFAHDGEFFISHNKGERECHERVTPINNQGEPLTQSEAGL